MHQSSYHVMTRFRELVEKNYQQSTIRLLDVGSYGVNGTYKEIFSDFTKYLYTGLDVTPGPNVDYVPSDPYRWSELQDESFDAIISGQAFEHIEYPWLIIEEMNRVLKTNGLICIVAPSRGPEHKYPVDCWRYYPDGFRALAKWAQLDVLDAKTSWGQSGFTDGSDQWGDTFCILYKPENQDKIIHRARKAKSASRSTNRNNPLRQNKQKSYYGYARPEVIEAIIKNNVPTGKVLEIGCAGGATGKNLKERLQVHSYVGIDISPEAADIAKKHLDRVIVANIEETDLASEHGLKPGEFDLLLALDVLEHLYDPWDVLAELTCYVKPGGYVVASLPNIQNISVVQDLIKGNWQYEDAGILDATHLRFFTLAEIKKMFAGAGLTLQRVEHVINPPLDLEKIKEKGNVYQQGHLEISDLTREALIQLFSYQYLLIACKPGVPGMSADARTLPGHASGSSDSQGKVGLPQFKQPKGVPGRTSIVILTFNQLEYTKKCVKSIRKHTVESHEIIFVDNGSTDGTVKWLKKQVRENDRCQLIENSENCGFAKGCNQGIEASTGEFILLLNNDVLVTQEWLSGMHECLNSASDSGIVGPMTNRISGPQQVVSEEYRSPDDLEQYARKFRERNRHRRIPLRRIVGFCMLFRRELVEKIGLLDEKFGTGNFEDDDFCLRALLEGYRNLIAGDVFIHHFGSRSFIGNKIDYQATLGNNRKMMDEKWRIPAAGVLGKKLIVLKEIEKAVVHCQRGKIELAIETLIDCIKVAPDYPGIYHEFARMMIEAKRFAEACDVVESMPDGAREELPGLECAAYAKEGLGDDDAAETYSNQMLRLDGACPSAMNLKGVLAHKKGDQAVALRWFGQAVDADPGYGEAYTNLGVLSWAEGKKEESLQFLRRGFVLSPAVPDHGSLYYSAVCSLDRYADAEAALGEARSLYPSHRNIAWLYIDSLVRQEKFGGALNAIEDAMALFGIDDDLLGAALSVREKIGPQGRDKGHCGSATLSLCMIVKNEEDHIVKCLRSVRNVVDEMIVVDTGSTDRTKALAKACGARVHDFSWTNDFAEARNYSLLQATGDWILILDADETLSPADHSVLRELIGRKYARPVAYDIVTRNYTTRLNVEGWTGNDGRYAAEEAGNGWYPSAKVRLFQNHALARFVNPVHECVEPSLLAAGMEIKPCPIPVHHYGRMGGTEKIQQKREAYYLMGRKKLEEKGDDPKAIYELALAAGELEKYAEACALWERFVKADPKVPSAFVNMGSVYMKLGRLEEALQASQKALALDPDLKEAAVNYAGCRILNGDVQGLAGLLEKVLQRVPDYIPARCLLATVYGLEGSLQQASACLELIRKKGFDTASYLCEHSRNLHALGRSGEASALLAAAVQTGHDNQETHRLLAAYGKGQGSAGGK